MANIVCFGEVLWDVFPSYKTIGGAPLNVALRLHSFANNVSIISSVGNDINGNELLHYIENQGLSKSYIQVNENFKTSEVLVALDTSGSASYTIEFPCAWDYISKDRNTIDLVKQSDAFVFGSLIVRNEISFNTLLAFLDVASFKVFDVNLRPPHYKISILEKLMKKADFIKFNDEELVEICNALGFISEDIKENIHFISKYTNTTKICVTLGKNGAVLYIDTTFYVNKGYIINVKDTVGAGDSFLATLVDKLLKNENPQKAIDFACAVGAIVASNVGANSKISEKQLLDFMRG